jgi:hypothetical protein
MIPNSVALAIRTGNRPGYPRKTSSDYQTACGSSENAQMGCTEPAAGRKATPCGGGNPENWPAATALTEAEHPSSRALRRISHVCFRHPTGA